MGTSWLVSWNGFLLLEMLFKSALPRMFLSSRRTQCYSIPPLCLSLPPFYPQSPLPTLCLPLPVLAPSFLPFCPPLTSSSVIPYTVNKGLWCLYWVQSRTSPVVSLCVISPLKTTSKLSLQSTSQGPCLVFEFTATVTLIGRWPVWVHFQRVQRKIFVPLSPSFMILTTSLNGNTINVSKKLLLNIERVEDGERYWV